MTRDGKEDSMSHVDEGTLHAYLDSELPPSERASLEAHIAQCGTCRALLADERALLERSTALLASARPVERPAPPFEQVRRAPRRPWYLRTPVAWAASIVLAIGLGYYLHDPGNFKSEPATVRTVGEADGRFGWHDSSAAADAPAEVATRAAVSTRQAQRRSQEQKTETREEAGQDKAAGARDSTVAGVVALEPTVQLRNAAPTPTHDSGARYLDEVVVTTGAKAQSNEVAALRGRAVTTQWQIISHGAATTLLGTDPVGLPGLRTRRIRRSPAPDATVVVEQALDSATTIQIFQRTTPEYGFSDRGAREAAPPAAAPAPPRADRLARFVGRLRVEISGPLTTDSLNKLLEQVEPIP
ncbi:MAG TPA: zf-HC2 domain-containing protein [Gemmatimonadales bacterium]|nr:zf-HC2 domain-containing protein [Gemmatimonadales bacterium]